MSGNTGKMPTILRQPDVVRLLKKQLILRINQKALAEELGISQQHLSDMLHGRRAPGPAVLDLLGLEGNLYAKKGRTP